MKESEYFYYQQLRQVQAMLSSDAFYSSLTNAELDNAVSSNTIQVVNQINHILDKLHNRVTTI